MKTIRDPKGNELKTVLLQVLEKDEQGPVMLRVRRDHEKIDLTDETHREFWMAWVPVDKVLGEMRLDDILSEYTTLKELSEQRNAAKAQLDRDIATIQHEHEKLEAEAKTKTEELRRLQRERDPERVAFLVAEAVKERTTTLEDQIRRQAGDIVERDRWIAELRESKRRLKEANDRLKERK